MDGGSCSGTRSTGGGGIFVATARVASGVLRCDLSPRGAHSAAGHRAGHAAGPQHYRWRSTSSLPRLLRRGPRSSPLIAIPWPLITLQFRSLSSCPNLWNSQIETQLIFELVISHVPVWHVKWNWFFINFSEVIVLPLTISFIKYSSFLSSVHF